jgi:hypothetical protein
LGFSGAYSGFLMLSLEKAYGDDLTRRAMPADVAAIALRSFPS